MVGGMGGQLEEIPDSFSTVWRVRRVVYHGSSSTPATAPGDTARTRLCVTQYRVRGEGDSGMSAA